MRAFKELGLLIAVCALGAIGAANASAATFTLSATGNLTGRAVAGEAGVQVFTTAAGQVKCTTAETSGTIASTASTDQHVTVNYKNCTAFGFANVHISPATYLFTANGTVHVNNTITINVTIGGCTLTVTPQTPTGSVSFIDDGNSLIVTPHVTGIHYDTAPAHGTLCGTAGTAGTYTGNSTISRVGGGSIDWDA